jgi:hypothetical protein
MTRPPRLSAALRLLCVAVSVYTRRVKQVGVGEEEDDES